MSFAQVVPSVECCKKAIEQIRDDQVPLTKLENDWSRFGEIGQIKESDRERVKHMTTAYCDALLRNLTSRFPQPEILAAFGIFDPIYCPTNRTDRRDYGKKQLQTLVD